MMSNYIDISKDEVVRLREQGLRLYEIAERFGCSRDKISRVLRGEKPALVHKSNCPICGAEYTFRGKTVKKNCGKEKCRKEWQRMRDKIKHEQAAPEGRIREYTETSNIMIIKDLENGWSIQQIAQLYDPDPADLKRHINKILQDGTVDKVKRRLKRYQENNMLKRGEWVVMSKEWIKEDNKLKLIFKPFYYEPDAVVATIYKGEDDDWYYTSNVLNDEDAYLCNADTCEHDAKLEMEERIYSHYEDERNYYQELLDRFVEG